MNTTVLARKQSEKEWVERSWIINITLFLCFANFRNDFFYLCLLVLAVVLIRKAFAHESLTVSKMFLGVLLFGIFFAVFGGSYFYRNNGLNGIAKCFLYPICFFIGENLVTGKREKGVQHIFWLMTFAMVFHGALNLLYNFDAMNSIGRNTYDVWTGQIWSATGQASLFVFLCGTVYYGLFLQEKKGLKLLTLLGTALMLFYNTVFLAGRLLFAALALCLVLGLLLSVIGGKEFGVRSHVRRKAMLALVFLLFAGVLFVMLWQNNIGNFRTLIEESNFFLRFSQGTLSDMVSDEARSSIRREYLRLIPTYLWGGDQLGLHTGSYGHDIFLSALNLGGLPSMLMVFVIFLGVLWQMWQTYRCKSISLSCRIWILSVYVASFALMAYEPVFEGIPWFAGAFLLVSGVINRFLREQS